MYKQLILFSIGAVLELSGCVIGYFVGELWGGIICIIGSCIMLMGAISALIKEYREKKKKKK